MYTVLAAKCEEYLYGTYMVNKFMVRKLTILLDKWIVI